MTDGRDFPSGMRVDAMRRHLAAALAAYQAETGDQHPWLFTVDALIYLGEWCSCAKPDLTRPFLEAMAVRGSDADPYRMAVTTEDILATRASLVKALIDMRGLAS